MIQNKTYSNLIQAWKLRFCLLCFKLTYIEVNQKGHYISLKHTAAQSKHHQKRRVTKKY